MVVALGALVGVSLASLISCQSVQRTVIAVPHTTGAEFVGSEECTICHESIAGTFTKTVHARLVVNGEHGKDLGCEACHGPGSLHSEAGGGAHLIHNPGRTSAACLRCHLDVEGQFALPHSHPVADGQLACIDCHDPHGDEERDLLAQGIASPENGACASCHPAQAGPFVFEHEAMRDGCTACHHTHGGIHQKMLLTPNATLCLQCHFTEQRDNALMIGGVDHTGFGYIQQGTCWAAGCHEAVHGSQVNGSLRF